MGKEKRLEELSACFGAHRPRPILHLRHFAVLALLTEIDGELHLVLNKRAKGINQPGDVCFPGGHREESETLQETALRETEEEIGIPREKIRVLGKSDYMLTVYRGMIQPFIGYVAPEDFACAKPNPMEVDEVFTVPFSFFLYTEPENHPMTWQAAETDDFPYERIEGGRAYPFSKSRIPELFYEYNGYTIWGFTAQVIQNIAETLLHFRQE